MRCPWKILPLTLLLSACKTGSPDTAIGAATMTAAAIGASAASRAAGGCIAMCTGGTVCNPRTGLCDPAPCGGRCDPSEHCEATFSSSRCVPGVAAIATQADGGSPVTPLAPVMQAPDPNRASPTIVPTAEQPHR